MANRRQPEPFKSLIWAVTKCHKVHKRVEIWTVQISLLDGRFLHRLKTNVYHTVKKLVPLTDYLQRSVESSMPIGKDGVRK